MESRKFDPRSESDWQQYQDACRREARRLAPDNPHRQKVLEYHLCFNQSWDMDVRASRANGKIEFFVVGRNASHQFYLGEMDGKLFRASLDCSLPCETCSVSEDGYYCNYSEHCSLLDDPGWGFNVDEIEDANGHYLGHY